jgi:hypothetical protein
VPTSPFGEGNAVGQRLTIPISLTTLAVAFDLLLLCVATDGKELWRRTIATGNTDVRGDEGNSASPSACTDGKHVWTVIYLRTFEALYAIGK